MQQNCSIRDSAVRHAKRRVKCVAEACMFQRWRQPVAQFWAIGEVGSVSASLICSAGSSLVGMMVDYCNSSKKLAIIVSLPESLVWE